MRPFDGIRVPPCDEVDVNSPLAESVRETPSETFDASGKTKLERMNDGQPHGLAILSAKTLW